MPAKKSKTAITRSRSASRDRVSTRKNASKKRSPSRDSTTRVSKSRSPASESKIRRRRSFSSSESRDISGKVKQTRKRQPRRSSESGATPSVDVSTSLRVIEKLDSSNIIENRTPKARKPSTSEKPELSRINRIVSNVSCFLCCLFSRIFSEATFCLLSLITLTALTFWLNFLVFSPTSAAMGEAGLTPWGRGVAFLGAQWPSDMHVYFQPFVFLGVLSYFLGMLLISRVLPLGRKLLVMIDGCPTDFRANGLSMLLLNILALILLQWKSEVYFKGVRPDIIFRYWPAVMCSCLLLSFVIGIHAFFHSFFATCPGRTTGSSIVDLFNGRETRPRMLGTDIKMLFFYPTIIGLRVLEIAMVLHQLNTQGKVSSALFVVMVLHGIHFLDYFIFEPTMMNSFTTTSEGFGLWRALRLTFIMPFTHSLNVFYLANNIDAGYSTDHLLSWNAFLLAAAILIFLCGLRIHRVANNQKYLFRRDPQHTSFIGMPTFPTSSGRRILAGGWWGSCRHPNYFGGILMAFGSTLPAGFASPLPWVSAIILILFMLRRIHLVERTCSQKYESAWPKYTAFVPYRLVPCVY